ncbi:MAG TPA: DUF58 domain-containing protein [Candidatus Binatia bacterium]|nr:DUF58 domain-containing protein [Candidatus Binatia bacterium]
MTLRDALLRARRRPRHLGAGSPTIYRGDGYEFVELRTYVPGDDVRRIDWAATARSGELQTRVVLEDVALTLAAIVDTSRSMCVGRKRPLLDAAREAVESWFAAAAGEDRCIRVEAERVTPAPLQRGAHRAQASCEASAGFDVAKVLRNARAALPRGTALLAVGDWYDLPPTLDRDLADLGTRFDCTALIARDPWADELPLSGIVRLRGAEGGNARVYVGARERAAFRRAVREREDTLAARFGAAGWRTGSLHERDGAASLAAAFGVARA